MFISFAAMYMLEPESHTLAWQGKKAAPHQGSGSHPYLQPVLRRTWREIQNCPQPGHTERERERCKQRS